MGLKTLISNLEAGNAFGDGFPNQSTPEAYNYGESISIFDTNIPSNKNDYFPFRQRSMGYGPKGINVESSLFGRGVSPTPFIQQKLPGLNEDQGSGTFDVIDDVSDSFVRGGLITATKRALIDAERIGKYLISSNGLAFIAKNVGMQRMNPKLQEGAGWLGRNRVYNLGINTLAQVATSFTGLHVNRAGVLPIGKGNYRVEQGYRVDTSNDTKYEYNVKGGRVVDGATYSSSGGTGDVTNLKDVYKGNRLTSLYNKIIGIQNPLGMKSGGNPELYKFGGGPHSVYGIGKTRLKRYNFTTRDTFLAVDKIKQDTTPYLSSRHLGQGMVGKTQTLLNEIIDFRKFIPDKAYSDYNAKDKFGKPILNRLGYPILTQQNKSTQLQRSFDSNGLPSFPNIPKFKDGTIDYTQKAYSDDETAGDGLYKPTQFYWVGDKINRMPIIRSTATSVSQIETTVAHKGVKDMIKFMIEAVNTDDPAETDTMVFRAYLESMDDDYAAKWNEFRYNGRSEPFYTYGNFKRSINFSFKIAASSRTELRPLYTKLNYLLTQTAGDYKKTRLRGNLNRVTIGDYLNRVPGVFTNIKLKWSKEYPWEIAYGKDGERPAKDGVHVDYDIFQLPHILDVSCAFLPIHDFIPRKSILNSPFIGPSEQMKTGITVHGNGASDVKWFGAFSDSANSVPEEILRDDRDDKEKLIQENAEATKEYEDDMAEMAALEQAERDEREEEERLQRVADYEAEEEAERLANKDAGLGYKTNFEVQQDEELEAMMEDLEEEDEDDPY